MVKRVRKINALTSVSQLNLQIRRALRRVAAVALALGIKQNVRFAVGDDVLRHFLHQRVIEMHPNAVVVSVGRVMTIAGAGSVVHDDGRQVVNAGGVGATRFRSVVQDELRQVQSVDGEVNAQVDLRTGMILSNKNLDGSDG